MMNKRSLKKAINAVSDQLFANAVAVSLYGNNRNAENDEALIQSILNMREDYVSRISHPEPGMKKQDYYKDLREKFISQAQELADQISL
jgi:phosphosulfolactate phosphohydrolase-like enzyme